MNRPIDVGNIDSERGSIAWMVRNRVTPNILMIAMLLAGVWALTNLNAQFFPNFEVEVVTVRTVWAGASAEDDQVFVC